MSDNIERKRSVDISTLNEEQVELLQEQIGIKIRELVDGTIEKANKILNIYGLQAKMQIVIQQKDE